MNQREYYQQKAEEFSKTHTNLILRWCTGAGKTLGILKCIEADTSGVEWYVITPEILQVRGLIDEIRKQGFGYLLGTKIAGIMCYASFKSLEGKEYNLWFNEVHKLSKLNEDIAKTVKYKRIFADSATIPKDVEERLNSLGNFFTYKISMKEAIEEGILPEPKVYILSTTPDDTTKRRYTVRKKGVYMTDKERIEYFDNQIKKWRIEKDSKEMNGEDAEWIEKLIIRLGSNRKQFIASSKTAQLKSLISDHLQNKRFLCFTGSIKQCDEVGKENAIHSKKSKKSNLNILSSFNSYKIDSLFTNKMGREGLNLEGIEAIVITQLSAGRDEGLEFIQKMGRGFRAQIPEIYILVSKETVDERFLKKALKNIDSKYVQYI